MGAAALHYQAPLFDAQAITQNASSLNTHRMMRRNATAVRVR